MSEKEDRKPETAKVDIDYQKQADAYVVALGKAKKRERILRTLARRRFLLGIRQSVRVATVLFFGAFIWRWATRGVSWDDPFFLAALVCLALWVFLPSRKKVEEFEAVVEREKQNGSS